jgi:hypothetical protein
MLSANVAITLLIFVLAPSLSLARAAKCYKTGHLLCDMVIPCASSFGLNFWLQHYVATANRYYITDLRQFVVTMLRSESKFLLHYGATAICGYNVTERQQFVITLWRYSNLWLQRYAATAIFVTLRSYSNLWLRHGATAICFYITELQKFVVTTLRSYSTL